MKSNPTFHFALVLLLVAGIFPANAQNHGVSAALDFHRRYPIPQLAMDANPMLE